MRSVCVFCGSSPGTEPTYSDVAASLGRTVARRGLRLVYGGGHRGLMGTLADAALAEGGEVIGIITRHLIDRELAHQGLTSLQVVEDMHSRKAAMAALAEGFIALPGGFGTLEEILEVLSWSQLGLHPHPVAFMDVDGFWQPLLQLFDRQVETGFLPAESRERLISEEDPGALLDRMAETTPEIRDRWRD